MKISGLDFLEDMEKRLRAWINMRPNVPELECRRFLNFREKTIVLKIGYPTAARETETTGEIACRMVEEPQDFYFRGVFKSLCGGNAYPFTLRPSKNYEIDFYNLIDAVGMGWLNALPAAPPEDAEEPAQELSPQDLIDQALFGSFTPAPTEPARELTPQELIDQALAGG